MTAHFQTSASAGSIDSGLGPPRRALIVAYGFPPTGGVSVQRITKFVKYLPEFGWNCSVLTVANPSVPIIDESLMREIPASTVIRRARTLEPGYATKSLVAATSEKTPSSPIAKARTLARGAARRAINFVLQPDAQILWRRHALKEGRKLLASMPHDVIVATGPPFSSFLVAATLAKETGLPLALDYRDEWAVMSFWENKQIGIVERNVQRRMQDIVVRRAALLTATTPATASELQRICQQAGGTARADYIYNGFDPSDYPADAMAAKRKDYGNGVDCFRLSFVGTLWNVAPIGPVVDAVIALSKRSPELAERLELVLAGRRTVQQDAELDRLASTPAKVVRLPFIPHREAIELMCGSDALLLINAEMPTTERLINAKAFEYMAARRPILVVASPGELRRLLGDLPGTLFAHPGDPAEVSAQIETALVRWREGAAFDVASWELTGFERRNLAGRFAKMLDSIAIVPRGAAP